MKKLLFLGLLLFACKTEPEKYIPNYLDCVEVKTGFYKGIIGVVTDKFLDIYVVWAINDDSLIPRKYVDRKEVFVKLDSKVCE